MLIINFIQHILIQLVELKERPNSISLFEFKQQAIKGPLNNRFDVHERQHLIWLSGPREEKAQELEGDCGPHKMSGWEWLRTLI